MTVRIRIAGYQDGRSVHTRAVRLMIRALLERIGGGVEVHFVENIAEQGRKAADLLDLVRSGDLDLCYFSSSYLTRRVPALGILDIPFQFMERERTRAQLSGRLGAALKQAIATRTEYEALSFWDNGLRNLSNSKRPIRMPEDCSGLRIRTLPSAGYHETFRALGMEPVTIDVADMVLAIAEGKVDAQENPLTNIQLFGLQRYHPFVTMTRHFHGIAVVLCNARSWNSWPGDIRSALDAAVSESTAAQWRLASDEERECQSALEAQGVSIIELSEAARLAFKLAVRGVVEKGYAALPPELSSLLDGGAAS
jgi:TRAP-type C4-dicarboxylate transport system substrate-binding protein